MAKRKAEYELDRKELEANNFELPSDKQASTAAQAPVDLSQRRIVKIRLPSEIMKEAQQAQTVTTTQAKFTLAESITTQPAEAAQNNNNQENKPPISFLNKIITPPIKEAEKPVVPGLVKPVESQPLNLFANLKPVSDTPPQVGLFSGFPSLGGVSSLFNSENSLFSKNPGVVNSLLTQLQSTSTLFSNTKKPEEPKPSLFASLLPKKVEVEERIETKTVVTEKIEPAKNDGEPPKPKGLFNEFFKSAPAAGNEPFSLFAKSGESGLTFKSLLTGENAPTSFFASKGDGEGGEEDGGSGDDDGSAGQRSPSPEPDKNQTTNFQYDDPFEKIISKDIEKFKAGENPLLGKGSASLNKSKDSDAYFLIFRNPAKLIQYQGQLVKSITTVAFMKNKLDTLNIMCVSQVASKEKTEKPKYSKDLVKLMFTTNEGASDFKKEVEKVL
jgi:hypothetical protein